MLVSCQFCGFVHKRGFSCSKRLRPKRTKEETLLTSFRSSYRWKQKREEIKKLDKYLCQICLIEKYHTERKYNFTNLEVHHIYKLEAFWEKRLLDDNLITICSYHHKMAEAGEIPKSVLMELTRKRKL